MLGCNNFQVIDLGVMVPCETILEQAAAEGVDIIGLSGLITPSLDEMVHVAREMERTRLRAAAADRRRDDQRQAHGGQDRPALRAPSVIHVLDASRSVGVVEKLINPEVAAASSTSTTASCKSNWSRRTSKRQEAKLVPYAEALAKRFQTDWADRRYSEARVHRRARARKCPAGKASRVHRLVAVLPDLGAQRQVPANLRRSATSARSASKLFDDAQELLDRIIREKLLTARGVYGFWPAASRRRRHRRLHRRIAHAKSYAASTRLRQQWERKGQDDFYSLADFIAPVDSGRKDYLGAFAVTAGIGCDELAARFDRDHDDYNSIMTKALADRLAEAFAEYLHAQARRDWGFGREEKLSSDDLIEEKYRGIRPAPGYPAQPDHTEKRTLFDLLDAERATGIKLTESFAMHPAASVSGLYFAHPQARYFAVDRLTRDQVEDYARRKGMTGRRNRTLALAEPGLRPGVTAITVLIRHELVHPKH